MDGGVADTTWLYTGRVFARAAYARDSMIVETSRVNLVVVQGARVAGFNSPCVHCLRSVVPPAPRSVKS
jgi:hypothetical protein